MSDSTSLAHRLYRRLAAASSPAPPLRLTGAAVATGLCACFAIAALSLWPQLDGLIGPTGLSPVHERFALYATRLGEDAAWRLPGLMWLSPDVGTAKWLCAATILVAALALLGRLRPPLFLLLAVLYLSLFSAGLPFTGFQWDLLLIECGFAAVFLHPLTLRQAPAGPRPLGLLALRVVLAKLVFSSGIKKWLGDDGTWRELTALDFHFFTQPLPNPLSSLFDALPHPVLAAGTALTLGLQVFAPLLLFGPRRARLCGAWLIVVHQVGIAATGNFAFFNLLTLVLCLACLDDAHLRACLGTVSLHIRQARYAPHRALPAWRVVAFGLLLGPWLLLQGVALAAAVGLDDKLPSPLHALDEAASPLRLVNGYGLFVRMTTRRLEIVYQATLDGETWAPYELPHKPGDPDRWPTVVAPHQPRLDWQLWFAALNPQRPAPYCRTLQQRLLDQDDAVLSLFETSPFDDQPPRGVRAVLYDYTFDYAGPHVWAREPAGTFLPPVWRR